jgi:uncharacterized Ntn-hydrolase superfamily protein
MTYTIIGRCSKTGRLGIGIATFSITVGRYAHCAKAMTGVTISQAFARYKFDFIRRGAKSSTR